MLAGYAGDTLTTTKVNMYILFSVEIPKDGEYHSEPQYTTKWRDFSKVVKERVKTMKGASMLHEGLWLLPVNGVLPILTEAIALSEAHGFPYKALLVDNFIDLSKSESKDMQINSHVADAFNKMPPTR